MDLVADALTRIRNAASARHLRVVVQHSRLVERIVEIMCQEGYLRKFEVVALPAGKKEIRIVLRSHPKTGYALQACQTVSKSSRRVYFGYKNLPLVKRGLGTTIVSTSHGVMTAQEAQKKHVGGEVLCTLF